MTRKKTFGPNLCFKLIALWLSENLWPESVFQVYRALALRKPLARIGVSSLSPALRKPLARICVSSFIAFWLSENLWPDSFAFCLF